MSDETVNNTQNSSTQREGNSVFQTPNRPNIGSSMKSRLFSDEIPYETIPLPSKGKIYPENTPLNNVETIDIKVMGPTEEDILTSPALLKKGTVISELLRSCIINKYINPGSMIAGDRNAIMVGIRAAGYGTKYGPIEIECSECQYADKEHYFDLNKLQIRPLQIEPVRPNENLFSFKLPVSGFTVFFKFLTGDEEENISRTKEAKKKKLGQIIENNVTEQLLNCIVQIEDVTDRAEISIFVTRHMNAKDSKALRRFMDENEPGMIMKQGHECPSCGHSEEVNIPIGVNFFWPE